MTTREERKSARRTRKDARRTARAARDFSSHRVAAEAFFASIALFISKHPWKVCIVSFLFNGLLGLGMLNLPASKLLNNDIEALYVPRGNPTQEMADELLKLFPDTSGHDFYEHQQVKQPLFGEVLLWRHDKGNILNGSTHHEIDHIVKYVKNISTFTIHGGYAKYGDLCALRKAKCVIHGEDIVEQIRNNTQGTIKVDTLTGNDTYQFDALTSNLADYTVEDGVVMNATYLKIRFHLRQDSESMMKNSKLWQDHFITYMKKFIRKQYPESLHIVFRHAGSFYEEIGNDTFMDIPYFSFVFTVFLTYLGIVMSGGNIISKRVNIGRIGILVTPVAVLGSWGLLMGAGLEFTNTVGVIPLIIQCHQIINAMITLSHLSDVNHVQDAHKRVAHAVSKSALPVTMTTIVHVFTFGLGITSPYYVVRLVSIYFVVTTLFNYFTNLFFFTACIALHEHRIDAELHFCCWNKLTPREKLQEEERNCCVICCCSGKRPETREDTESGTERATRKLMSRYILTTPVKAVTTLAFVVLMIFTIWGLTMYDFDSVQVNKVLPKSYFTNWDKYWSQAFDNESTVQFIAIHPEGFMLNHTMISDFKNSIQTKRYLRPETLHSWYDTYVNAYSGNFTGEEEFVKSVETGFISNHPEYRYDLVVDKIRPRIIATRFYLKTRDIVSTKKMMELKRNLNYHMDEINDYVGQKKDDDDDDIAEYPFNWKVMDGRHYIAHSPDFRATDMYMQPLFEIIKMLCVQFIVLTMGTFCLCPNVCTLIHTVIWYFSMLAGMFGLSHFAGIYLTPVPMICYIVAACYSVEVIGHTMYYFMITPGTDKASRMNTVLSTISQALFHTIFGQFLGLLVMIVDDSYVFVTVFLVFIIANGLAVLHTIFFIPVALAMFGACVNTLPRDSIDSYRPGLASVATVELSLLDRPNGRRVTSNGATNGRTNGAANGQTNGAANGRAKNGVNNHI